jgi:hypothetical protein
MYHYNVSEKRRSRKPSSGGAMFLKCNIMTFCFWCGREYEPHESQASEPKKYCCQLCEDEAKKEEEEGDKE